MGSDLTPNRLQTDIDQELSGYASLFVQRQPRHGRQYPNKNWKTIWKPLSDPVIKSHLQGEYSAGTIAPWYPGYAIIDIDGRPMQEAEAIRAQFGLDETNSLLCTSPSPNCWHLFFKPTYNGNPPTTRLLQDILKPLVKKYGVESYPMAKKVVRLPFGPGQVPVADGFIIEDISLSDRLKWFAGLDEFPLETINGVQLPLLDPEQEASPVDNVISFPIQTHSGMYNEGQLLYMQGLQTRHTRHHSQFAVLYYLWRRNTEISTAIDTTWKWIRAKHNGFSQQMKLRPDSVFSEIRRQAYLIWNHYDSTATLPDQPSVWLQGWLSKADIEQAVRLVNGKLPKLRYLTSIVQHINPRRGRQGVSIHSDLLKKWSSKTNYLRWLEEFEASGLLTRSSDYTIKDYSKKISLKWAFKPFSKAILDDSRSLGLQEAVKRAFTPEEFRTSLRKTGSSRTSSLMTVSSLFESVKN